VEYSTFRKANSRLATQKVFKSGRAIAQAVSHRGGPGSVPGLASGICSEQSGAGAGFLRVLRFPLPIFIPPNFPSSQSSSAGTIGHSVADVPSGPSSTPHYANRRKNVHKILPQAPTLSQIECTYSRTLSLRYIVTLSYNLRLYITNFLFVLG
jgi:hypothetical protein